MDRAARRQARRKDYSARSAPGGAGAGRSFSQRLKSEYAAFLAQIEGIARQEDRAWYAALMLNRLMALYFLQKRGSLPGSLSETPPGDPDYLSRRLHAVQARDDGDPSRSFYRSFLLQLLREISGPTRTGEPGNARSVESGLFADHALERAYPAIHIPDSAFARLFAFFDEFEWRAGPNGRPGARTVSPAVLGMLFEQQTDQKRFGSYYTTADITEYIAAATIIPFLFDAVRRRCPAAFRPGGPLWSLLKEDPDRYMYHAQKHGCALALPPEIAEGLHTISLRERWNGFAPAAYALPLESWREVIARRRRYSEIQARIEEDALVTVDEMITCNLDLRRFAGEAIRRCADAELLDAFYACMTSMAILDPTCGSGAFLQAALQVLEPLYRACLERMQEMLRAQTGRSASASAAQSALAHFQGVLQEANAYSTLQYWIRRSILTQNLYGIEIMPEAVECCKLGLFLQMCEQGEAFPEIALLPLLDRHLRAGDALAGLATPGDWPAAKLPALPRCAEPGEGRASRPGADRLDSEERAAVWQASGRPFHWWIEFREVMARGGFDVIIGNPPYVADKIGLCRGQFYETEPCGNLCAYTLERALALLRPGGRCGMIVPVSAISSENYRPLSKLLLRRRVWVSSYSNRPGKLFSGVEQRLAILLISNAHPPALFSSPYRHWYEPERAHLFQTLSYTPSSTWSRTGMPLKSGTPLAEAIFSRLNQRTGFPLLRCERAGAAVWVHDGPTYWVRALPFEPNGGCGSARSNHYHRIPVSNQRDAFILAAILSSSTFYLFYKLVSNCRDLGRRELRCFPLGDLQPELAEELAALGRSLAERLQATAAQCSRRYASGVVIYEEYYPARAKTLLDEIDRVLARHYGFSEEEVDFILHYEIKYRMGRDQARMPPA